MWDSRNEGSGMKLNWAERWVVNNPLRVLEQRIEIGWFKRRSPLGTGFVALEIGCGRGAGAQLVLREFHPFRVHATDLDMEMLRKAENYLPPESRHHISLSAADASSLPIKTGSVDAVFGFGVIHHALDWRASLAEVSRVLRPGGVYFMEELYPALYQNFMTKHILLHPMGNRFSSSDLGDALAEAGLNLRDALECKWLGILGVAVKL